MSNPLKWPGAAVAITGLLVVGAIMVVAMLVGINGVVRSAGFALLGIILGGGVAYPIAKHKKPPDQPPSTTPS